MGFVSLSFHRDRMGLGIFFLNSTIKKLIKALGKWGKDRKKKVGGSGTLLERKWYEILLL
jgi:hypothetical protein